MQEQVMHRASSVVVVLSVGEGLCRQASSSHNQSSLVLVSDCETSAATL